MLLVLSCFSIFFETWNIFYGKKTNQTYKITLIKVITILSLNFLRLAQCETCASTADIQSFTHPGAEIIRCYTRLQFSIGIFYTRRL